MTINDTNRRLVSAIFDVLGNRPLDRIGETCPTIFDEASEAGLVSLVRWIRQRTGAPI